MPSANHELRRIDRFELMFLRELRGLSTAIQARTIRLRKQAHATIAESQKIIQQSRKLLDACRVARSKDASSPLAGLQIGRTGPGRNQAKRKSGRKRVSASSLETLTPRECEILSLIVSSYSTKQIAGLLKISFRTAVNHRTHIMSKLGIHDIAGLTRFAIAAGLISVESEAPHVTF